VCLRKSRTGVLKYASNPPWPRCSLPNLEEANDNAADRKFRGFLLHKYFLGWFQN
jgi:hypothetical protein